MLAYTYSCTNAVVRRQDFDLLGELPDLLLQVLPPLHGPPQLPPQVLDLCRQPLQRANLPLSVMALETSSMRLYVIAHLRICAFKIFRKCGF